MKITGKKLAEALSALGKLIIRTSPVELHQAISLEARDGQLSLRTVAQDESLTATIPAEGAADFRHAVHYAKLRELTRNPAGTVTFMELNDGFAAQLECRRKIVTHALPVLNIDWPEAEAAPAEAETVALPENFTALLSEAAPLVNRNEARHQLRGIHLCPEGIAATDGKQLLHLPLDLDVEESGHAAVSVGAADREAGGPRNADGLEAEGHSVFQDRSRRFSLERQSSVRQLSGVAEGDP